MTDSHLPNPDDSAKKDVNSEEEQVVRRGGITTIFSAFRHINEASITDQIRQRMSDYISIALVASCIIVFIVTVALSRSNTPSMLLVLPLILTIVAVAFYVMNRVGIMVSLTSRQALIIWQIVIATFWLGILATMLVIMLSVYIFGHGKFGQ